MKKWHEVGGWFNESDVQEYQRLINLCPDNSVIVEVGVFCGRSLLAAAEVAIPKGIKILAIDNWSQFTEANAKAYFFENVYGLLLSGDSSILQMSSQRASSILTNVELVFLDDDHSYAAVSNNIANWSKKTKILAGHDYLTFPEVKEALDPHKVTVNGNVWSMLCK